MAMTDANGLRTCFEDALGTEKFASGAHTALYEPISYVLGMRAKRIRPVLAMLSYQLASGRPGEEAIGVAKAVEYFHNFTLIHDDIMDNAPVRRGLQTVHIKWDVDTAILSGDALFVVALQHLIRDFPAFSSELVNEYSRISLGVCEGQMEDMLLANKREASIAEYLEMIRKKTAMLIGGSLSLGAIAAGASEEMVEKFYYLGETLGLGFQIQDDYLDAFADQEKFGKQVGGDIIEGKQTYLLLKAFELAKPAERNWLLHTLESEMDNEEKVRQIVSFFKSSGAAKAAQDLANEYFENARVAMEDLSGLPGYTYLGDFLQQILGRDF